MNVRGGVLGLIVLLAALAGPWAARAAETEGGNAVVDLDEASFGDTLRSNAYVLVEFFAPWCGHCKNLEPEYERAAKMLADASSSAVLARVDGTQNRKLMEQFRVEGFPTLIYFRKGAPMLYQGPRDAAGIAAWVLQHSGPAMIKISSAQELEAFAKEHATRVVAYIPASDSEKMEAFETFTESPGIVGEFKCAIVSDEALFGEAGARVALDRSFDDAVVYGSYNGMTPESLNEWAINNGHPYYESMLVSWKRMVARKLRVAVVFIDEDAENVDEVQEWVAKLAKEFHESFSFGYLTSQYAKEASTLGAGEPPTVVVMPADARSTWPYKTFGKAFTEENVREWLNLVATEKIGRTIRSDPVPETNDGPVKVVVGSTFEQIVLDPSKHVLIEFYADWCGHCKRLAPVYEELGQHFSDADDVVIAKIEASRNDNEHVDIAGFPTLFFFPKGEQKAHPVEFEGERTLEALIEFVNDMRAGKVPNFAEEHDHSHGDEL